MKILKEAEVINVRREGTRNFYYLDPVLHFTKGKTWAYTQCGGVGKRFGIIFGTVVS